MRKNWMGLLVALMLAVGLAACGGNDDANEKTDNNTGETGGETASSDADAEALVKQNCIACHGENLEGKNGPELAHIGAELSKDEILDVIQNGRTGMPANLVTGDDADKVAQWLSEKK